jgi:hypothetical protein
MKLDQTVQLKIAHSLKSEPKIRLIQGGGTTSRNYQTKIPPEFKLIYINCHLVAESFLFLVSRHMRARSGDHGSRSEMAAGIGSNLPQTVLAFSMVLLTVVCHLTYYLF